MEVESKGASDERVAELVIEMQEIRADKITLETQTAEQCIAAYALKHEERDAIRAAKAAERDRKCAEKEVEEEAQSVTKKAQCDAKWSAEEDAMIEKMIDGGFSFDKIASKWGNDQNKMDIYYRWTSYLKKLSGIIKPPVQPGPTRSINWTADVDAAIARMRTDDISFAKIAMAYQKITS